MSNETRTVEQSCDTSVPCQAMDLLIRPREKALGGFSVRRVLPTKERKLVGPWIFFDHMGPADFPAGEGVDVRPHPHVNLATVTYLFEGEMLHRDSVGSVQAIRPGDINLMVAGRGIVHSERESPEVHNRAHRAHGLQLWLALPEADEETEPAFYHYPSDDIPRADVDGVAVRVMMGSAYGVTSPVHTFAETLYLEAALESGQSLELPDVAERAVYVVSGSLSAQDTEIPEHSMAIFSQGAGITLTAGTDARIAVIGGEPLGYRYIEWNFVSSRKERIEQAKADWQAGHFPEIPDDHDEHIPLP